MPNIASTRVTDVSTYAGLKKRVEETLLHGQRKIEEAKVLTYWNTGRLIHEHILQYKDRADYGQYVLEKLSVDLRISKRLVERTVRFYRQFPKIAAARPQLTWSHYRTLMTVDDDKKRSALAALAGETELSSRELEIKIRDYHSMENAGGKPPVLLAVPSIGHFFTYRLIRPETVHSKSNDLLIDLGFSVTVEASLFGRADSLRADSIVTSLKVREDEYKLQRAEGADESKLFTYKAFVERVIDGDTMKVEIDLGFKMRIRQTIRLKGLDCPEMDTAEGKAAKKFVEDQVKSCQWIIVRTTRSDKYDRYLGDVWCPAGKGDGKEPAVYLNNLLLEKRLAVRM